MQQAQLKLAELQPSQTLEALLFNIKTIKLIKCFEIILKSQNFTT
jgi:hypothetical protein